MASSASVPGPEGLPATVGSPGPAAAAVPDPREAQFLATEHWSLLATRSLSWNEAFSRSGMFLSTLSAATVALALVGPATSFGQEFIVFALVILSVTLFLGVATFVRLTQVNNEDVYWVAGMNRLRSAYVRLVPGIEHDFVAGWTLDPPGISRTFAAVDVVSKPSPLHMLVTTPAVVGIISAAIAAVIAGLLTIEASTAMSAAVGVGIVVFIATVVLFIVYGIRESRTYLERMSGLIGMPIESQIQTPPAAPRGPGER
jgi:hypothetical protein